MVWTLRISDIASCSNSLITPLPAWMRLVMAKIEDTISNDSYEFLPSGMKMWESSLRSRSVAASLIS